MIFMIIFFIYILIPKYNRATIVCILYCILCQYREKVLYMPMVYNDKELVKNGKKIHWIGALYRFIPLDPFWIGSKQIIFGSN